MLVVIYASIGWIPQRLPWSVEHENRQPKAIWGKWRNRNNPGCGALLRFHFLISCEGAVNVKRQFFIDELLLDWSYSYRTGSHQRTESRKIFALKTNTVRVPVPLLLCTYRTVLSLFPSLFMALFLKCLGHRFQRWSVATLCCSSENVKSMLENTNSRWRGKKNCPIGSDENQYLYVPTPTCVGTTTCSLYQCWCANPALNR